MKPSPRILQELCLGVLILSVVVILLQNHLPHRSSPHPSDPVSVAPSLQMPTPTVPVYKVLSDGSQTQFVVLSFDGSYSLDMWRKTLDFARQQKVSGVPVKYTYFVNGIYLLPADRSSVYQAPRQKVGDSLIGFALNSRDVALRIDYINQAIRDGHEIGSHLNGHFSGNDWTADEWQQEFSAFANFLSRPDYYNIPPDGLNFSDYKLSISPRNIIGFRAPNLAVNSALWPVLVRNGYRYDAGQPGKMGDWPQKSDGLWKFPIVSVRVSGTDSYVLAMDYNFYVFQSRAVNTLTRSTPGWITARNQVVKSFEDYLDYHLATSRAPVFFSAHFSDWNDELYWEAMKIFAAHTCARPQVQCLTYAELVTFLDRRTGPL